MHEQAVDVPGHPGGEPHARDGGGGIVGPDARGGQGKAHAGVVPAQLLAGRGAAADRRFQQTLAER